MDEGCRAAWTASRVPLCSRLTPRRLTAIVLAQSEPDNVQHTLYIDDIRIEGGTESTVPPKPPSGLEARGYERHIDLHWHDSQDSTVAQYVIYRSLNGGPFKAIGVQRYGVGRFSDYIGDSHASATYRLTARTTTLAESAETAPATAENSPHD